MGEGELRVCLAVDESPKPSSVCTYRPYFCLRTAATHTGCSTPRLWSRYIKFPLFKPLEKLSWMNHNVKFTVNSDWDQEIEKIVCLFVCTLISTVSPRNTHRANSLKLQARLWLVEKKTLSGASDGRRMRGERDERKRGWEERAEEKRRGNRKAWSSMSKRALWLSWLWSVAHMHT